MHYQQKRPPAAVPLLSCLKDNAKAAEDKRQNHPTATTHTYTAENGISAEKTGCLSNFYRDLSQKEATALPQQGFLHTFALR
ncbi:MAG: hypothetical protein ACI3YA_06570 [Alloprevotella sp.]